MTPPVNASLRPAAPDLWDDAGVAPASWRIEMEPVVQQRPVASPFFAEQTAKACEQAITSLPVMLQSLDGAGRIVAVNSRWLDVLGIRFADVEGRSFNEMLTPESRSRLTGNIYPDYLKTGRCRREPLSLLRPDGSVLPVLMSMSAMRSERGRIERSLCLLEEPVAAEAIAQATPRATPLPEGTDQEQSAVLASEFNNLLTVMLGRLELVAGRVAGDEKVARHIGEALAAARQATDLNRKFRLGGSEPPAPEPAATPVVPSRRQKILVVEDQDGVRAVACGFLEDMGYDMIEAVDGLDALAKLREHPDIDLMFSDVVMPGGLNGFDLAQAARGIRPGLRIVHTSGYPKGAMVHQEEPRFREGFIIMKPYRREELQKIIRDALAAPG